MTIYSLVLILYLGLLQGHGGYVPIIPAILLSGTKEVLLLLSPASHPASIYFLFPSILNVTLHSSSYLEEDEVPGI